MDQPIKTPVDIISGFLGSGKTTLLNKMLGTVYKGIRIAIVENEFGEVNIDSQLLPQDVSIKEMSNGCACCTLRVELIDGLIKLNKLNRFDRIVIEPTGVAKLSDMLSLFETDRLNKAVKKGVMIAVVNPLFHTRYSEILGDFYLNQIKHADLIYMTRTKKTPKDILIDVTADIKLSNDVMIVNQLPNNLLTIDFKNNILNNNHDNHHQHHHHDDAPDMFLTYTRRFDDVFSEETITDLIDNILTSAKGDVLRIKGTLTCSDTFCFVQWVPGELNIKKTTHSDNLLVVIETRN